jgi:hypothetical protein
MKYSIQIVDDFYQDPDRVRRYALEQKFYKRVGDYPGLRCDRLSDLNRPFFEFFANKLTELYFDKNVNIEYDIISNFQSIDGRHSKGWIHQDDNGYFDVAGVVYLSPDAPIGAGTSIYRPTVDVVKPKPEDIPIDPYSIENIDMDEYDKQQEIYNSQFEKILEVGNIYNRLVVYPVTEWHTQSGFFGVDKESSRLTLVFFAKFTIC